MKDSSLKFGCAVWLGMALWFFIAFPTAFGWGYSWAALLPACLLVLLLALLLASALGKSKRVALTVLWISSLLYAGSVMEFLFCGWHIASGWRTELMLVIMMVLMLASGGVVMLAFRNLCSAEESHSGDSEM